MLTPVTAQYFTMEYQTGSAIWKEKIHVHIEKELQNLQKVYQKTQDQIRSSGTACVERTAGRQSRSCRIYYRQLLTYEPEYSKGYLEYGLFCADRQVSGSRAVSDSGKTGQKKKECR